jgi:hypothetical protein
VNVASALEYFVAGRSIAADTDDMRIRRMMLFSVLTTSVVLLCSCSHPDARSTSPPSTGSSTSIPDDLRVSGTVLLHVKAHGVQIYTCMPNASGGLTWSAAVPDADFAADDGTKGKHFAGPTWQLEGGAKIVGQKLREHASPDATAIPWLLLAVKSRQGDAPFATTAFIQRLNTTGGKAPPLTNQKAGDQIRVPYTAEYIFYGPDATTGP